MRYVFDIYRCESAAGPWELLSENVPEYHFVDEKLEDPVMPGGTKHEPVHFYSLHRAIYYRVVAKPETGEPVEEIKQLESDLDHRRQGLHHKLTRDAYVYMRVWGTEVAIFKRRHWGERCPHCLTYSGRTTRSHCSYCFGITLLGGYWNPFYGYAQKHRSTTPIQVQTAPQGQVETHRLEVLMMNIPQVEPGDFLVFLRDQRRYMIEVVQPTQIQNVDVHQELVVSELARGDSEYALKADPWRDPKLF